MVIKITTKDPEIKFEIEFTMFLWWRNCWWCSAVLISTAGEGEIFLQIIGVNRENRENNYQTESRNNPRFSANVRS